MGKCAHHRSLLKGQEEDVIEEMENEEERDASEDTNKDETHGIESRHFFNSFKKCKKHCHHGHCPEVKHGIWKCAHHRSLLEGEAEDVIEEMEEERDATVDTDKDENHGIESRTIAYTSHLQCLAKCDTYCYAMPQGGWVCLR